MTNSQPVEFEIAPAHLGYAVSVLLQPTAGRWLAVADWPGSQQAGLGGTAREALVAALGPLGPQTTAVLMADPALFGAGLRVRAA